MSNQLTLIPITRDHKDVVMTPDDVARDIVAHFKPSGRVLDPCKGDGAFLRHMPGADWCEIREGRDFFAWREPVDWIVSNPPYSIFSEWLQHSFTVANDIVYLIPTNKPFNSDFLLRQIYKFGGIPEIYSCGPGSLFPSAGIGFAVGAVHFQRNYRGGIKMTFRGQA